MAQHAPEQVAVTPGAAAKSADRSAAGDKAAEVAFVQQRLASLDAYRGLIMILLAASGFGLADMAGRQIEKHGESAFWSGVKFQFGHVEWAGCAVWDMIQPSFMFMVGVAMAFSYAQRQRQGHSRRRLLLHAIWRSVVLVLLAIFLTSNWEKSTQWVFSNVLAQIGLGYTFVFLLWRRSPWAQGIAAAAILLGTWLVFACYPHAGIDLERGAPDVGVAQQWAQEHLTNVPRAWHKNANVGQAVDLYLLNMFPTEKPFTYNRGGYQTINFIPAIVTMLFGLMAGELLRSQRSGAWKLTLLIATGLAGLILGYVLSHTGACPIIKRIWSPAWALFSTGWCCLILAALYGVIDLIGFRAWAFPLVVVGMNSITAYCMGMLLRPWIASTFKVHLGSDIFLVFGDVYEPVVRNTMTGLFIWLTCYWLYRQKVFIRI